MPGDTSESVPSRGDEAEAEAEAGAGAGAGSGELLAPSRVVSLGSGRTIETETHGDVDLIRVRARGGQCVLTVRVTDEGPVLSFSGAALEIATRSIDIACETLRVRSTAGAAIDVGGDVTTRVAGSVTHEIQGALMAQARSVAVASEGGVTVRANDDVKLNGERVLLNSDDPPMPLTWEEYQARHPERALGEGDKPQAPNDEAASSMPTAASERK